MWVQLYRKNRWHVSATSYGWCVESIKTAYQGNENVPFAMTRNSVSTRLRSLFCTGNLQAGVYADVLKLCHIMNTAQKVMQLCRKADLYKTKTITKNFHSWKYFPLWSLLLNTICIYCIYLCYLLFCVLRLQEGDAQIASKRNFHKHILSNICKSRGTQNIAFA